MKCTNKKLLHFLKCELNLVFVSIQRQVFAALSQISKHSVSLAEMVIEAEILPAAVTCLRDPDEYVRKNVSTLMREVVKHTPEVCQETHTERHTYEKAGHKVMCVCVCVCVCVFSAVPGDCELRWHGGSDRLSGQLSRKPSSAGDHDAGIHCDSQ